jgi:hypothetical protein
VPTNTILTIGMVTRELLDAFDTNRVFSKHIYNEFSTEFAQPGAKIGPTLNVRLPARLAVTSGPVMTPSDYLEESTPLTIDQQEKVGLSFTSFEMTLSMDDWRKRVGEPTSIVLSNKVDAYGLGLYWKCPNAILSPSTGSAKWLAYLNAGAIMADNGAPADGDWTAILNQYEQAQVVNENKGLFNPGSDIGTQNKRGMMGESAGLTWYWDQNVATHTTGQRGGTPTYTSTGAGGTSIVTGAWTAAAANRLKRGDIFTIANVYAVNPVSLNNTGQLRQFTALADANSDASGNATIQIYPAIIGPGSPRQTVNALPVASAPLTMLGTANTVYHQNEVFQRQAWLMAMCRLTDPYSGEASYATDSTSGVAIRTWRSSDIINDAHLSRADIAFGVAPGRPEWCVRVWSTPPTL